MQRLTLLLVRTLLLFVSTTLVACDKEQPPITPDPTDTIPDTPKALLLNTALAGGKDLLVSTKVMDVNPAFAATLTFSHALDTTSVTKLTVRLIQGTNLIPLKFGYSNAYKTLEVSSVSPLSALSSYKLSLSGQLKGKAGNVFTSKEMSFSTAADSTDKFPRITDEALLTKVQEQTFKYFWDFGHPVSGLARERESSGDMVTIGGSGFGVMAMIVAIERGFITREQGVERLTKIVTFLDDVAACYHGAWPHWINGATGAAMSFSPKDDGADLVETSYMIHGLLTVRQYLNTNDPEEKALYDRIQKLWEEVEWDWFTRGGQNVLYWHWSPNFGWEMNMPIRGYNECLITYFLAAASPTHPVSAQVYHQGWAQNGAIKNGKTFYGITLPLGFDYGGPLFFSHYSFLGLDPRGLKDTYANYWEQNTRHTQINRAYCVANPKKFSGYSADCWGLTASDNHQGYSAHSPTDDLGVISPTAALSSMPYTPTESMQALRYFYYKLGDKLWGQYGFYDAFNPTVGWWASSFLAIDQGPIIVMIENHRTGKLWDLFMTSPEVAPAMQTLGFTR